MSAVRLILALHNHQPVGNFDGVFEAAYRESYLPFLEVMEDYPQIPFVLHTSGPLMEWLVERHSEYIARVRSLVEAGRVEILGGGFFEPIMTMIPHRDRVGQIRDYSAYLEELFPTKIRGMWVPERVWEQQLVSSFAAAGIEYTILDDFHFQGAGVAREDLHGYYLTEDDGHLLKIFPGSEPLRYAIPFREPHEAYLILRKLADEHPGATVVCADDGEKFGSWPDTFDHVYTHGWLRRFCDMLVGNRAWIQPTTLAATVDSTLPQGKVYLPDSSYREMNEWALSPARFAQYESARRGADGVDEAELARSFVRAGGTWRNFKARYPESDEMYARMLGVSQRLAAVQLAANADPDYLDAARHDLYRGQCNCPYWHGSFGGLYLPHLRNAIYRHLISADNALDGAEGRSGARVEATAADLDLDALREVRLENDRLIAFVRPARGGHIYELDARDALTNILATLDRRPEVYHARIAAALNGQADAGDKVRLKQKGLDRLLVYDRHPRKALVDHFYALDATRDQVASCADVERGDFVIGTYLAKLQRDRGRVALVMDRPGWADGHLIHIRKTIELAAGSSELEVSYVLGDLPPGQPIHFAVEINLAAMAGHADDRYYSDCSGDRLGMLDARLDLPPTSGLTVTDEWLDIAVGLSWSSPGGVWCFPVETVSQSEGGFEAVYQSSAIIPHWIVTADDSRRWELRLSWTIDRARPERGPDLTRRTAASRVGLPFGG
jgi:alpha-amylase